MSNEILTLSLVEISEKVKAKVISPVELTEMVLKYIDKLNYQINAYISILRENAMKAAYEAEKEIIRGKYRGILHGIPIGVKDNIYIKDEITTMGSNIHRSFTPKYDAEVILKLRKEGAIFIGKLNMHEYAWGITNNNPHYGSCRNPLNLNKISGGSSGGSGAAVKADMAFASLGTDTGGSIRIPASACGVVGLKPTFGVISNVGSFPLAPTLDHIGPITKTVKDSIAMFELMRDKPLHLKKTNFNFLKSDIKEFTVGINESFFFTDIEKGIQNQIDITLKNLKDKGIKIKKIKIPCTEEIRWAQSVILRAEFHYTHRYNKINKFKKFGKDIQKQLSNEPPTVVNYLYALEIRKKSQKN